MKKSILITGIAGSGKSTIAKRLEELGYKAFSIETIPGLFVTVDAETKEPIESNHNNDLNKIKKTEWICDRNKLSTLIHNSPDEVTFYCGTSSNIQDMVDLFDSVIILSATPETLRYRLNTRTTHDYARSVDVQDWLLSWKENWEKYMQERGATIISADGDVGEVIKRVLEVSSA